MKHLRKLLTTQFSRQISKTWLVALVLIAGFGFADATFLTLEHYLNKIPPCTTSGCETVLTSAYATIAGIPVALGGVVYYLAILILLIIYMDTKNEKFLRYALASTSVGFIASLYFLSLQAFVLDAYCLYCLFSLVSSTLLFISSVTIFAKYSPRNQPILL